MDVDTQTLENSAERCSENLLINRGKRFAFLLNRHGRELTSMTKLKIFAATGLIFVAAAVSFSQQPLFVVGGGERPAAGMKKFVEWSGGDNAKLLMVTWASGVPDESFEALKKGFGQFPHSSIDHGAIRPLDAEKRARFIQQLKAATGVFFSGGDQNRIMDVLADEELLRLIRAKYAAGTPFVPARPLSRIR